MKRNKQKENVSNVTSKKTKPTQGKVHPLVWCEGRIMVMEENRHGDLFGCEEVGRTWHIS